VLAAKKGQPIILKKAHRKLQENVLRAGEFSQSEYRSNKFEAFFELWV
jgi:hypothetical protein